MTLAETEWTSSGRQWFVARVRPNSERVAAINLQRQEFHAFLPVRIRTIRHARQFRTVHAPLFPGYIFIELDTSQQRWRSVNGTYGIVSLLMSGSRPQAVPTGIVESLKALSSDGDVVRFDHSLNLGQRVRLLAGPFAEAIGVLDQLDDRGRVRVLLEMMGSVVPVASRMEELVPA